MFVLERILGRRQPVGAPAHRGTAVEDGVTAGLIDPAKPIEECSGRLQEIRSRLRPSGDKRREEYRETSPAW
jgi:hypothetical protein